MSDDQGISLRNHFAAAALQGMLANPAATGLNPQQVADYAFGFADAMVELTHEVAAERKVERAYKARLGPVLQQAAQQRGEG